MLRQRITKNFIKSLGLVNLSRSVQTKSHGEDFEIGIFFSASYKVRFLNNIERLEYLDQIFTDEKKRNDEISFCSHVSFVRHYLCFINTIDFLFYCRESPFV